MDMVCAFTRCCADGNYPAARTWMRGSIEAATTMLGEDSETVAKLQAILHPAPVDSPLPSPPSSWPPSPPGSSCAATAPPTPEPSRSPTPDPQPTPTPEPQHSWHTPHLPYSQLDATARRAIEHAAEQRLRDHNREAFLVFGDGEAAAARSTPPTPASLEPNAIWLVRGVLAPDECLKLRELIDQAVAARGGWDKDRHRRYPTTDLPLSAVPAVEWCLRGLTFSRILEPMAAFYCGEVPCLCLCP